MSSQIEWAVAVKSLSSLGVRIQGVDDDISVGLVLRFPENIAIDHKLFSGDSPGEIQQWLNGCAKLNRVPGTQRTIRPGAPDMVRVDTDAIADVVSSVFPKAKVIVSQLTAAERLIYELAEKMSGLKVETIPLDKKFVRDAGALSDDGYTLTSDAESKIGTVFLKDYYDSWLDNPIPALRGKTPRQAALTEEGRQELEDLFVYMHERFGPNNKMMPDIGQIRKKLGLPAAS